MSWDQGYTSPDERAAQDRAAEEARQRARMQPFERRLLDYLGEISASLARIADNSEPFYDLDAASGELKVHHGNADAIAKLLQAIRDVAQPITSTAAGVDGGVGAESVVAPDSAHPTSQPQ